MGAEEWAGSDVGARVVGSGHWRRFGGWFAMGPALLESAEEARLTTSDGTLVARRARHRISRVARFGCLLLFSLRLYSRPHFQRESCRPARNLGRGRDTLGLFRP